MVNCYPFKNNNEIDSSMSINNNCKGAKTNNNTIRATTSNCLFNGKVYINQNKNKLNLFEKGKIQQILNKKKEENNKNIEEQYKREKKEEELKLELSKKDEENRGN